MKRVLLLLFLLSLSETIYCQTHNSFADSVLQVLKTAKEDTNKVNSLNLLSRNLWDNGEYTQSMSYAREALSLAERLKYPIGIAKAYHNTAINYRVMGNYPKALSNHLAGLKILVAINNKRGILASYLSIGVVYSEQGNYAEALSNYFAALSIAEQINDKNNIAFAYNSIGSAYGNQGNYSLALSNYSAALKAATDNGQKLIMAYSLGNIGNIYSRRKNYGEAISNYSAALKILEELGDKLGIAVSYINLGSLSTSIGKYKDARIYLKKAINLSRETGNKYQMQESYLQLAVLDSVTGNLSEAYKYLRLHLKLKDSILNEKSSKQISQLKIEYETEKKDQQIKTQELKLQNQELQNRILQISIIVGVVMSGIISLLLYSRNRRKKSEYEHLLTDLELSILKSQFNPHFISNSLINIKEFIDQQPKAVDQFLSKFARLMRKVLEENEKQLTSLKEELETAELYMQIETIKLRYGFDYHISCDTSIDTESFLVPPLILQPVIENAIWHGLTYKEEKGYINISVTFESDLLKFVVEDNGVGQELKIENENNRPTGKKSFGLSIIRKRIALLNKEFKSNGYFNLTFLDGKTKAEIALPSIHL